MSVLHVRLLGKLELKHDDRTVVLSQPHKAQEAFAYLLLHRGHSHTREALANLLWQGKDAGKKTPQVPDPGIQTR